MWVGVRGITGHGRAVVVVSALFQGRLPVGADVDIRAVDRITPRINWLQCLVRPRHRSRCSIAGCVAREQVAPPATRLIERYQQFIDCISIPAVKYQISTGVVSVIEAAGYG